MQSVVTYFTGGFEYSIPNTLLFTYFTSQLRFILASYVISYYFSVDYSIITMALAMLFADLRFFIDFGEYMNSAEEIYEEEDDE